MIQQDSRRPIAASRTGLLEFLTSWFGGFASDQPLPYSKAKATVRKGYWRSSCVGAKDHVERILQNSGRVRVESAAMTAIPAKVLAVGKQADKHHIIVRIVLQRYRGSFNTLKFGENKPLMGSCYDGRLDLIYCRDPGLEEGQSFPLWTIQ